MQCSGGDITHPIVTPSHFRQGSELNGTATYTCYVTQHIGEFQTVSEVHGKVSIASDIPKYALKTIDL